MTDQDLFLYHTSLSLIYYKKKATGIICLFKTKSEKFCHALIKVRLLS